MTIHCQNQFVAIESGIERLKRFGVDEEQLIRHSDAIVAGLVIITRDRPGKEPWFAALEPSVRWITVKRAMGL